MSAGPPSHKSFDKTCRDCARLADFLDSVRATHPDYHSAPVPPFGDAQARLLIVGLAPGMHGANRTGRPFTGDYAGILLYRTLHRFGFATRDHSASADDGLELVGCRITNAVKCLPPQNKPALSELRACNGYLAAELARLEPGSAILALGTLAHRAVLLALRLKASEYPFSHAAIHRLPGESAHTLFDSYHCSRYNTQTRRLSEEMFERVLSAISGYLGASNRIAGAENI